jgi:hypothetical protein
VAEQFLHGPDVIPVLKEMSRERVAQRVGGGPLRDAGPTNGGLHHALEHGLVEMVPAALAGGAVGVSPTVALA